MESYVYKVLRSESEGLFKDRGSKFLAYAFPVDHDEQVKAFITKLKKEHHSARHHCYAYRIGFQDEKFRMNDDGEPSGTAGKPIYGQIQSFELYNTLIVVVRYFGGTLLGTSGLINAYRSATRDCLLNAVIGEHIVMQRVEVIFTYSQMNQMMRIVSEEGIQIREKDFSAHCQMKLDIPKSSFKKAMGRIVKIPDIQLIE